MTTPETSPSGSAKTPGSSPRFSYFNIDKSAFLGRKISQRTCLDATMSILIIVGAILCVFGIVALTGYFGQSGKLNPFVQHIHHFSAKIATKIGTDILTISLMSSIVGGTLLVGGAGTIAQQHCSDPGEIFQL